MIVIRFDMMLLPLRLMAGDPSCSATGMQGDSQPQKSEAPAGVGFPVAAGVDSSTSKPAYERLKEL
jgi:hypothetical protein